MEDTKQKLEALGPQINRILQISGSPGLSLGVLHKGITHTAHYGHRNAIDTAPANDDTS
ncbi:hypothetical protein DM02DRAFT_611802 [Periconia macrospinosa]|uniref:Uncharacterized protein n=1 Tax=Periconia macrospinosa TaxID=97972 RepID=A0A2V1E1H6_9PLEO|nr:hypothetical protein DM02DRAFT_611802 [Periconia macrospinosa]